MGKIGIVLGQSKSGKSRSIKNLDPKSTVVIQAVNKDLPFKGSRQTWSPEHKNLAFIDEWDELIAFLKMISSDMPHVKTVVIDDLRYVTVKEFFKRAKEVGYGKFTEMGQHFNAIFSAAENTREDLNIFMLLHDENVYNEGAIIGKKVKLSGRMVEEHANPIELVAIVLYCSSEFNKEGLPEYNFYTGKTLVNGIEIPAATPEGMFENLKIPNDLNLVIKAINDYY